MSKENSPKGKNSYPKGFAVLPVKKAKGEMTSFVFFFI